MLPARSFFEVVLFLSLQAHEKLSRKPINGGLCESWR